jgi:predicted aspartyl protease
VGLFEVQVKVANPAAPDRPREVALQVDARAALSSLPRNFLEELGISADSRRAFELPDGGRIEREVGWMLFSIGNRTACTSVVFAEAGEESILGRATLESLGIVVNPVAKKLVACDLRH